MLLDINIDAGASGAPVLKGTTVIGLVQGFGQSYVRGNPVESVRSYLRGIGVQPDATSSSSSVAPPTQPPTSSSVNEIAVKLQPTIVGKDLAPMVLIPKGKFWMGSRKDDEYSYHDQVPRHEVNLAAFYINIYEVTTSRCNQFMKATNRRAPNYWEQVDPSRDGNKPVVGITWRDAKVYCEWAGGRLPTEAEWEKAARGTDDRKYPWGDYEPWSNSELSKSIVNLFGEREDSYSETAPVGSFPDGASPYGVLDMSGNVAEWTRQLESVSRVVRGGSWANTPISVRASNRGSIGANADRSEFVGFRCAQ